MFSLKNGYNPWTVRTALRGKSINNIHQLNPQKHDANNKETPELEGGGGGGGATCLASAFPWTFKIAGLASNGRLS